MDSILWYPESNSQIDRSVSTRVNVSMSVSDNPPHLFLYFNSFLDQSLEGVLLGSNMSSTGFVTFLDLTSLTTAASAPLTSKPQVLDVTVAPEPKDIIWKNAHISLKTQSRRENTTNIILGIIGFLWIL